MQLKHRGWGFATLDRYVAREVIEPFVLGVTLLTFALVTGRLLKLTEMVVNHGVKLTEVLAVIGYVMPGFLELTFPMAILLGVLLGFGRMSGDREMIAARACGVSLYRLAIPVMLVALAVYLCSTWFAFSIRPWANSSLDDTLHDLARTRAAAGLKEKVFNGNFEGLVLYVDHIDEDGSGLRGVLISDARGTDQNTIIASHGVLAPDEGTGALTLRLYNGSVFGADPKTEASHITNFKVYDITIAPDEIAPSVRDPNEMSYPELRDVIAKGRASGKPDHIAEAELARKYMVPVASLLFAMLGISLGLKPARGGQSERFGVAVALFFVYYSLMRIGQTFAERGVLNAFVAMAIPNVVFAALAIWMFMRSAEDLGDQGRSPGDLIWDLIDRFGRSRPAA